MKSPGVSVLTLVKGRAAHLAGLIEGLRRSDVVPSELVIVDMDGGYEPPHSCGFPIRVTGMPSEGLPLARARNVAAASSVAEVLLFLDVDCIPTRFLVGGMAQHVHQTPGLICADVKYLGPGAVGEDWHESELLERALPHPVRHFPAQGLRLESNHGLFWSLAFGIRRSQFLELGGFDEAYTGYGAEDTDFGFRAKDAAMSLYFLGGVSVLHQHHDVFDPPLQHFSDIVRNAVLFHHKWKIWPMDGWLDRFDAMGLIERRNDTIRIVRKPTKDEIARAKADREF